MMNLKEAFRFQNKLNELLNDCRGILFNRRNVTLTKNTHLRKKVIPEAENETTVEKGDSEYADRINGVVDVMLRLLEEREQLFRVIRRAKQSLELDFDSEATMNDCRRVSLNALRFMADLRAREETVPDGGFGYRFNADGNQVTYKCDLTRVTTINFDRNKVRKALGELCEKTESVSRRMDQALVNTQVDYDPPFDVNASFDEIFECLTGEA